MALGTVLVSSPALRRRRGVVGRSSRAGPRSRRSKNTAIVSIAVLCFLSAWPASPASPVPTADGVVPATIVDRYLAVRPTLGAVVVANIGGASSGQRLLASTLQGVVNRTSARFYVVGMRPGSDDQFWLDRYTARGLVTVSSSGDLEDALDTFATEATGYVVATESEPWTINTATSVAAAERGVVATPELIAGLQARGLTQIDDHRGRWPDAATAYESIATTYRSRLAYQGVAVQEPDRAQPRDFYVQQGVMTVFTRPSHPDFDRVFGLVDSYPASHPVYGYVADDGAEEVTAVARLAQAGRFLVPTNTTSNLSFHVAVGAGSPRAIAPDPAQNDGGPCTQSQVNVVLAMSDGDNLAIPEGVYTHDDQWSSDRRGELPMGWSLGPGTAVLMPSIWDHYATTATARDELVGMMGLGYTYTSLMPNGAEYFSDSFTLDATLGLETHWSLDALLTQPDAPGWSLVHAGATQAGVAPQGMLLNYLDFGGPDWHHTIDGFPVLNSRQSAYEDGPAELAAQVQTIIDKAPEQRPLVSFFAVTVWNGSYDAVADAMAPLVAQGVRFLTPSEAFACLPPPPPITTTTTVPFDGVSTTTGPVPRQGVPAQHAVLATPRFTA